MTRAPETIGDAAPLNAALRAELGEAHDLAFLARLPQAAQLRLAAQLQQARLAQQTALSQAIDHGLRMVPLLLRGPLKKILFG